MQICSVNFQFYLLVLVVTTFVFIFPFLRVAARAVWYGSVRPGPNYWCSWTGPRPSAAGPYYRYEICRKQYDTVLEGGGSVPDLDGPVGTTRDEDLGMVVVPRDTVHGHVMCVVRVEERARVRLGARVKLAVLRADQVQVVLVHMEVKRCTTTYIRTPSSSSSSSSSSLWKSIPHTIRSSQTSGTFKKT